MTVGKGVGAKPAGVGIDEVNPSMVGWFVASVFLVGFGVGAICAGVGATDSKPVLVG